MKVVALIPLKLNNERCPGKNTRAFNNGKPLVTYILETLKKVKKVDEIYVYCSNEKIKDYLSNNIKFLKRDPKFDSQSASMNEILLEFSKEVPADIYVLAHATAPFLSTNSIQDGLSKVLSRKYDSAFTVIKLNEFIWKDNKPLNYNLDNIPRTQDLYPLYVETTGLYIYTHELITKENRRIGYNPYLIPISKMEACDINDEDDFIVADAIFNSLYKE